MKKKTKKKKETELVLTPRLGYIGYCLLLFGVCFFIYALQSPEKQEATVSQIPEEELSAFVELSPHDNFNFFAVSSLFVSLGLACLFTSKQRMRSLQKKR